MKMGKQKKACSHHDSYELFKSQVELDARSIYSGV